MNTTLDGAGWASDYAILLLQSLGATVQRTHRCVDAHPALTWAQSGAMALTGEGAASPLMCPAPLASCIEGVRLAVMALAGAELPLPGAETLGERAALSGLQRNGAISPGGACRLLRAADGWLAVNLPRADDWDLLPAWLACAVTANWEGLAAELPRHPVAELLERGRLLGLAVADVAASAQAIPLWQVVTQSGMPRCAPLRKHPVVVDLSSLWAGPLCSHLLQLVGARVIKVESLQRPDGARQGPAAFYDLLNHGKASVALDFSTPQGIAQLRALLMSADIVIEASRPRALRQLGIDAGQLVATTPGLTWISISGYGRGAAQENWIAYGDDAGVAAGLSGLLLDLTGEPLICGDAIADPLTGWHAALAALASWRGGGGRLVALSLCDVVAHCLQFKRSATADALRSRWQEWSALAATAGVAAPLARNPVGPARALGADTAAICAEFKLPC